MKTAYGTAALALLLALAMAGAGCDDASYPCGPEVPAGHLQGRVQTGIPVAATVLATRIQDGEAGRTHEIAVGDDGSYGLDLPGGRYVVSVRIRHRYVYDHTGGLPGYGQVAPDTVQIAAETSPVTIDFTLGGLRFGLDVSDRLDGEQGEIVLHRRDADGHDGWQTYVDGESATIENGHADLALGGVLPGEYRIEVVLGRRVYSCYCPYDGEHFWLPGTRDREQSPWVAVATDSVPRLTCALATEPAVLEGRIAGAWRDLGVGAAPLLSIFAPDSTLVMGRRRVAEDGRFSVPLQLPGPVKLCVTQNSVEQWIGGPGFADATVFAPEFGEIIADIELIQSGLRVTAVGDGRGMGNARFAFHDPVDGRLLATAEVSPGTTGEIPVPNLWPGQFLLHVSPGGSGGNDFVVVPAAEYGWWLPQWFDGVDDPDAAQVVTIGAGEVVPLTLTLEPGGEIAGRLEPTGPLTSWSYAVLVRVGEDLACHEDFVSQHDPSFRFVGLTDGDYHLGVVPEAAGWNHADPPPAGTVWYPGTLDRGAATAVAIVDAAVVTGLVVPVTP